MSRFDDLFLAHPHAAGESYFEHMCFAFRFGWRLFKASAAAFAHGVVPQAFETTASTTVLAMGDELRARRAALAAGKQRQAMACNGAEAAPSR
jgi:hypothetical protein